MLTRSCRSRPSLTPDERRAALEKAAVARRIRAEVKEQLKTGALTLGELFEPRRRRRGARQAQGREHARVDAEHREGQGAAAHARPRHQRESAPPRPGPEPAPAPARALRARALTAVTTPVGVLVVIAGPSGTGKGTVVRRLLEREPDLVVLGVGHRPPAAARRGRGARLPLRHPRRVLPIARRGRAPRVVRGLRRPEGHAACPGRGAPRRGRRRAHRGGRAGGPRRSATLCRRRSWCSCARPRARSRRAACAIGPLPKPRSSVRPSTRGSSSAGWPRPRRRRRAASRLRRGRRQRRPRPHRRRARLLLEARRTGSRGVRQRLNPTATHGVPLHLHVVFPRSLELTRMADRRASLMDPRMEHLLDRVDSKFTLVTLAAMRAARDQRLLQPAR